MLFRSRKESKVPWTVYRPALVVGDSTTGEMDKIDGPYYFFKLIQRMRPPSRPTLGIHGGSNWRIRWISLKK